MAMTTESSPKTGEAAGSKLSVSPGVEGFAPLTFHDDARRTVAADLVDQDKSGDGLPLDGVVIFILVLALAFIAFIAYLIHLTPNK